MELPTKEQRLRILRSMILVRAFEDRITAIVQGGDRVPGIQILATGQEAAVAAVHALGEQDVLVSNHRSHAHILARGADPRTLMAEIMGKATGVNGGRSGTLHLIVPAVRALMTSTVVGAGPPMAVGAAFAQQYRNEGTITAVFFGDGAAAEGSVHEAMNLAAVWKLPILFVCENNRWAGAQSVQVHCPGGEIVPRAASYGMSSEAVDGTDADAVYLATARLAAPARQGNGPSLLELMTYRMHGHSEADGQLYVDPQELEEWAGRDPIQRYVARLLDEGICLPPEIEAFRETAAATVNESVAFAENSPDPLPEAALEHVWSWSSSPGASSGGGG
jgi:TPP-dependent pyruvate/acetoin dehydrogenase alpha subunit